MWQHDALNSAELVHEYRKPGTQCCHASVCVAYRGKHLKTEQMCYIRLGFAVAGPMGCETLCGA